MVRRDSVPVLQSSSMPASGQWAKATRLPAAWLLKLFTSNCELPIADGEDEVARAVLETLAVIAPDAQLGVLYPSSPKADPAATAVAPDAVWRAFRANRRGEVIVTEPSVESGPGKRLFPASAGELIVEASEVAGVSLHIAHDGVDQLTGDGLLAELLQSAALGLGRGMLLARRHRAALLATVELREASARLVQAEKLASLGQLAAGVVHELNNPLTSIVAYTDMLLKTFDEPHADASVVLRLSRIRTAAAELTRFSRELVNYARPTAKAAPTPVDVIDVITTAHTFCEHLFEESGLSFKLTPPAAPLMTLGRPEQLTQVFVNLFVNAVHAQRAVDPRALEVTASATADGVEIVVADSGPGVPPDVRDRIFETFFTTKETGTGTGLGLAIVRGIVDEHGGTIRLLPTDPAAPGAKFLVRLPAYG